MYSSRPYVPLLFTQRSISEGQIGVMIFTLCRLKHSLKLAPQLALRILKLLPLLQLEGADTPLQSR